MLDFLFKYFRQVPGFWFILLCIVCLVVGLVLLIKGADFFVSSASTLAKKLGVSSLVIGLTVVSIGTSLPEASVSISSAIKGSSGLSLGNVVGSNIFNILVVLGCSCIFAPIIVDKGLKKRDLPILIGIGVLLLIFTLCFNKTNSYDILRFEAIILLVLFIGYIILCILTTKKDEEEETEEKPKMKAWLCIIIIIVSGFAIACGGEFVTFGAQELALKMGADDVLVGLTIVAVGTSLPELVTSIMAAKKKENAIAVGNAVGSSIFNILFILGAAATISPYVGVNPDVITDIIIMIVIFVLTTVLVIFCKNGIGKAVGISFLLLYAAYLTFIILRQYCF